MYGAQLMEALRRAAMGAGQSPATTKTLQLEFFGGGGERMRAAGCEIIVDAKDLAVVGITEVLSRLPKILGLYRKLIRAADEKRPALAVVIDAPAFNWRVARQMRKRGIPVVYYVCPQFWAWRQGRVKLLRKYVNKALVIFPFEEKFYRDRGVDATFVGHPLADLAAPAISREAYAAENQLDAAKPWITLMPGSRRKEVRMNLPTILGAADRLQKDRLGSGYEFLLPVARTLDSSFLKWLIAASEETRQAASLQRNFHLVPDALPALYHSRSAIVASGTAVRRPSGQRKDAAEAPVFGPSRALDYELEVGFFVGPGNALGQPIPIAEAEAHIFGLCLLNDWSARDIQSWEYQPLGPFLAKNFATSISPWIVTMEALAPFRAPASRRPEGDPDPLPYLSSPEDRRQGAIDLTLEVYIRSPRMDAPMRLSRGNLRDLYWTPAQLLTHHTSNGCNLRPGDLLGSGTVSGVRPEARGCLLELTQRGADPIRLPTGETRKFLEDGDEVILRGYCEREGFARIGFGDCRGTIAG